MNTELELNKLKSDSALIFKKLFISVLGKIKVEKDEKVRVLLLEVLSDIFLSITKFSMEYDYAVFTDPFLGDFYELDRPDLLDVQKLIFSKIDTGEFDKYIKF